MTSCTFTSSIDLALIYNLSSYAVITNDAFIPDISSNWLAALAPPIVGLSRPVPSNTVTQTRSYTPPTYLLQKLWPYILTSLRAFLTLVTSAPCLLKNAAASNVRGPDLLIKTICIYRYSSIQSTAQARSLTHHLPYCIISVTTRMPMKHTDLHMKAQHLLSYHLSVCDDQIRLPFYTYQEV